MSGSIAAVAATTALVATLDAGAPDQTVMLGGFVFDGWEIPEKITWGGAQRLNVHKLIGGERVIDAMGEDNADITWSGIFLSPDASLRADMLDQMRKDGGLFELIFAGRFYSVVISNFQADQRLLSYVPYTITLTVQRDQSAPDFPYQDNPQAAAAADTIAALSFIDTPPLALVPAFAAMALVPPLLTPLPALVAGTVATEAVVASLATADALVTTVTRTTDAQIGLMAAASVETATLAGATTVVTAVPAMQAALVATETAAVAAASGALIGRALATTERV